MKAGMAQWLLDLWEHDERTWTSDHQRMNVTILPCWAYTRALALRTVGEVGVSPVFSLA